MVPPTGSRFVPQKSLIKPDSREPRAENSALFHNLRYLPPSSSLEYTRELHIHDTASEQALKASRSSGRADELFNKNALVHNTTPASPAIQIRDLIPKHSASVSPRNTPANSKLVDRLDDLLLDEILRERRNISRTNNSSLRNHELPANDTEGDVIHETDKDFTWKRAKSTAMDLTSSIPEPLIFLIDAVRGFQKESLSENREKKDHSTLNWMFCLLRSYLPNYPLMGTADMMDLHSRFLDASKILRSNPLRDQNRGDIETFLASGKFEVYDMYWNIRGSKPLVTNVISHTDSVLSTSGLLLMMAGYPLSRYQIQTNRSEAVKGAKMAIDLLLLDLSYGHDHWNSWYRLAQSFEVLAQGLPECVSATAKAGQCYIRAIGSYHQHVHEDSDFEAISDLYHDFGVFTCFSAFKMEPRWGISGADMWRMAISLLTRAIEITPKKSK